jgi:acetylornithine/succinyldiaminopimelate/putrescine aminotransferase
MLGNPSVPALLPVYAQLPLVPVSGRGSLLFDADGQAWLDAYGGHAVAATGHCHPTVVRAISEQAAQLLFYSTALPHPVREALAAELVARCPAPLSSVFFCNSGAEANENALHLARKQTGRSLIVALAGSFHGRTAATQAVTSGEKYAATARRAGLPLGRMVPFDDVAALDAALDDQIAAVIVEPVQGMAGARACSPEFLAAARRLCDQRGALLIFDEVQCGVGRTGHFTAAESFGVTPDFITLAKGLASGLPIGAMITTASLAETVHTGDLGSTFGGGPVPCAAARATLQVIDAERLLENVRSVSAQLREGALALGPGAVSAVQGRGLLLGLKLGRPAADVQKALFARRILVGTAADPSVLRLLPPLSFTPEQASQLLSALAEVLS